MKIISKKKAYSPSKGVIEDHIDLTDRESAQSAWRFNHNGMLFVTPRAQKELDDHIEWGEKTRNNTVELIGLMVGRVFYSESDNRLIGICEHMVPIETRGSAAYVRASNDLSYEAVNKANEIAKESGEDCRVIGWYHTHPNSLNVFMSGVDERNQMTAFPAEWHFALVLNPQKMIWRAFRSTQLLEVNCVFVCDHNSVFMNSASMKLDKSCEHIFDDHTQDAGYDEDDDGYEAVEESGTEDDTDVTREDEAEDGTSDEENGPADALSDADGGSGFSPAAETASEPTEAEKSADDGIDENSSDQSAE